MKSILCKYLISNVEKKSSVLLQLRCTLLPHLFYFRGTNEQSIKLESRTIPESHFPVSHLTCGSQTILRIFIPPAEHFPADHYLPEKTFLRVTFPRTEK
jgi:hypothetical protein